MAKTIAQLRQEAQTIRDASAVGENTATRVGGAIEDVVDYLDTEVTDGNFASGENIENVSIFDDTADLTGKTDAQKALMLPNGKIVDAIEAQIANVSSSFATGEEIGDVSIFDDPSDLTGKTDAEKALMIPNGLAYGQGGGGDTSDIENMIAVAVLDDSDITPERGYVRSANSTWASSGSMYTWKITNIDSYVRIKAHVRNSDTGAYALSFFSSETISAATKLASYTHSAQGWDDFDVEIPQGTQLICVTTRQSYYSDSKFHIYGLQNYELQNIKDRVGIIETENAIVPVGLANFVNGTQWGNYNTFVVNAKMIGDPNLHDLSEYLIDGKLVIINLYTGTNQVKYKVDWFKADGSANSYTNLIVMSHGETLITPRADSAFFGIGFGMNDSGGTEITAGDVSMYNGLYYKKPITFNRQITENVGTLQEIGHRLDVMDNYGNPLYLGKDKMVYNGVYFGRRLNFEKRFKSVSKGIGPGGYQGAAVWNDLLFTFNKDHKNCYVIDMVTRTVIQTITLTQETNFHCNCVNFGVEYADASDEFPLLYVDGFYTKTCYVYRITGTRGAYELTKMQTITYPTEWNHPEMFIDHDRSLMWVLDEQTSGVILRRMPIPTLSQGDVTLQASSATDEINIGVTDIVQAGSIHNGDLYFGVGLTGHGVLLVIDLYAEKRIVTTLACGTEPEQPFIYDNMLRVWSTASILDIYTT